LSNTENGSVACRLIVYRNDIDLLNQKTECLLYFFTFTKISLYRRKARPFLWGFFYENNSWIFSKKINVVANKLLAVLQAKRITWIFIFLKRNKNWNKKVVLLTVALNDPNRDLPFDLLSPRVGIFLRRLFFVC
jgi:hypothetical protein